MTWVSDLKVKLGSAGAEAWGFPARPPATWQVEFATLAPAVVSPAGPARCSHVLFWPVHFGLDASCPSSLFLWALSHLPGS